MLPYLAAASGHHLYIKSKTVDLQTMENLSESHPDVYQNFVEGIHSIQFEEAIQSGQVCWQKLSLKKTFTKDIRRIDKGKRFV